MNIAANTNSKGFRCATTFSGSIDGEFEFGARRLNDDDVMHKISLFIKQNGHDEDAYETAMDILDDYLAGRTKAVNF